MSIWELPKEPKFYDYESPITRAVREATETMMKQEEAECMAVITREVGYSVDKNELIKALNYDREQYDKGYRDGVKETFKTELEKIKAETIIDELEKIKAEIEYYRKNHNCDVLKCLDIIDKEIKGARRSIWRKGENE